MKASRSWNEEVAQIAARSGVDAFAVDQIDDALILRNLFPSALILVIGYTIQSRLADAVAQDIHLTVYDPIAIEQIELASARLAKTASVHLKLETGTARQGIVREQLSDILDALTRAEHVNVEGLSTHFANVEEAQDPRFATLQFQRFQEIVQKIRASGFDPRLIHCACSAAIILYPDTHMTMVRAGISLYGLWPSEEVETVARKHGIRCDLLPALTWKTRVARVKSLPVGTPVGYGLTETLSKRSRIAVLPVGYFDGYDRRLSGCGEVLIGGYRCKVVGRVCMNMMMVDVSAVPHVEIEQEVILLGRSGRHSMSADVLAKK